MTYSEASFVAVPVFKRNRFVGFFVFFALFFGVVGTGVEAAFELGDTSTDSSQAEAKVVWHDSLVVANRHQGRFPNVATLARELSMLEPGLRYLPALSATALNQAKMSQQESVFTITGDSPNHAELLVRGQQAEPVSVSGSIADLEPSVQNAIHYHFNWPLFFILDGVFLLSALLAATLAERSAGREVLMGEQRGLARWQEHVPDLTFGPLEPEHAFAVLVASARDEEDAVVFSCERLAWGAGYRSWYPVEAFVSTPITDNGRAPLAEERLARADYDVEEIATRWVAYVTRVAHENALAWYERQQSLPIEQAQAEVAALSRQEEIPLVPHLPSAAEVMRAFPLDYAEQALQDAVTPSH